MGLQSAFSIVNWPALASSFFAVVSSFSLILLAKLVLTPLAFSFPATLALLHTSTIALALWFWTIFGMLRPRDLPLAPVLSVALPSALSDTLALAALRHNTISAFHASRLAIPAIPLLLDLLHRACITATDSLFLYHSPGGACRNSASSTRANSSLSSATISLSPFERDSSRRLPAIYISCALLASSVSVMTSDPLPSVRGISIAAAASLAAALTQAGTLSIRRSINASELQLQLYTKSFSAIAIVFLIPIFDDVSPTSPHSLLNYRFPEGYTIHIFATALLAFLSFVSVRASASRTSHLFFTAQMLVLSILVFVTDKLLFFPNFVIPPVWVASVVVLLLTAVALSILHEMERDDAHGSYVDEETAAVELQRQQRENYHVNIEVSTSSSANAAMLGRASEHLIQRGLAKDRVVSRKRGTSCGISSGRGSPSSHGSTELRLGLKHFPGDIESNRAAAHQGACYHRTSPATLAHLTSPAPMIDSHSRIGEENL